MKALHSLCYGAPGKKHTRKKTLRAFNGFADASEDAVEAKVDRLTANKKIHVSQVKEMCAVLGQERSGTKEELATRIMQFLANPSAAGKKSE